MVQIPRGWPLYIWVYEDLNPKMEKILDFLEFFGSFQDFWIFWTLFGLFCKQIRIFSCFRGFWTFFRPNFLDFLDFFRIFWIFGIDFLGCTKTFLSGQPLDKFNCSFFSNVVYTKITYLLGWFKTEFALGKEVKYTLWKW